MKKQTINILIQAKGRMANQVEKLFKKNKLKILKKGKRTLEATIKGHPQLRVLYMNTSEIIPSLARNTGDIGISGKDLWKESEPNIQSKVSIAKEYKWGLSNLVVCVDTNWIDCINSADLEDISYEFYGGHPMGTKMYDVHEIEGENVWVVNLKANLYSYLRKKKDLCVVPQNFKI